MSILFFEPEKPFCFIDFSLQIFVIAVKAINTVFIMSDCLSDICLELTDHSVSLIHLPSQTFILARYMPMTIFKIIISSSLLLKLTSRIMNNLFIVRVLLRNL